MAMSLKLVGLSCVIAASLLSPAYAQFFSESCNNYPQDGQDVQGDSPANFKIMYTASAGVDFDDTSDVKLATDTATLEAKAGIARFLNEAVAVEQAIDNAINKSSTMSGNEKQVVKTETTRALKNLSSSSSAMLRGVVVLGGCYTKAKLVRVTVGIKPETIATAGAISSSMGNPGGGQQAPRPSATPAGPPPTPSQPLNGVDGYSNTTRLKNF